MKRDMDLIRKLLFLEEGETDIDLGEYSEEQIAYHKSLLIESGLCKGSCVKDGQGIVVDAHIISLTWTGHDFIDSAKDDTIWNKVKSKVLTVGGVVALDVMLELLKQEVKSRLGIGS